MTCKSKRKGKVKQWNCTYSPNLTCLVPTAFSNALFLFLLSLVKSNRVESWSSHSLIASPFIFSLLVITNIITLLNSVESPNLDLSGLARCSIGLSSSRFLLPTPYSLLPPTSKLQAPRISLPLPVSFSSPAITYFSSSCTSHYLISFNLKFNLRLFTFSARVVASLMRCDAVLIPRSLSTEVRVSLFIVRFSRSEPKHQSIKRQPSYSLEPTTYFNCASAPYYS